MTSKQYVTEFWTPMTINAGGQSVSCNFGCDDETGPDAPLCIIPTQARHAVEDPVGVTEKPNVITPWLDLLTSAGARILLVHGRYFDNLRELASMVREGRDGLAEWSDRMIGVVDEALRRGMGRQGKILLMGSSRHGFGVLHATALNPRVDATVAIGPVIWWPWLKEFHGMDDAPILARHHLIDLASRIAPRPALVQIGYDDDRVGQHWNRRFVKAMASAYAAAGASDSFTAQSLEKRGHDVAPVPMSVNRFVITWMERHGFL